MSSKARKIEIDEATAARLEARAAERGISVPELVAGLAALDAQDWPEQLEALRARGEGPWSPEALAEDERAFDEFERTGAGVPWEEAKAWLES